MENKNLIDYYDTDRDIQIEILNNKKAWQLMLELYGKTKLYTPEEEKQVFMEYKKNPTPELRNEIVRHNIKLAISCALKYKNFVQNGMEEDDLVQEGFLGLMIAIDKFDPDMGNKFSTYAIWWIQQKINRYIESHSYSIRIPNHVTQVYIRYKKWLNKRETENLPIPSDDEIIDELKITYSQLETLKIIENMRALSLNVTVSDGDEELEFINTISDPNSETGFEQLENNELRDVFENMLEKYANSLSIKIRKRNVEIIRRRLGLNEYGEIETLESIATDYGLTRERIRQIENRFIKYLNMPINRRILRRYL